MYCLDISFEQGYDMADVYSLYLYTYVYYAFCSMVGTQLQLFHLHLG